MQEVTLIANIANVIQLAVAPVFLLTGIAGLLGVLSNRLGRITDRARIVESSLHRSRQSQRSARLVEESKLLWRRIRLINSAIRLCTSSALLVCLVIVVIFVGYYTVVDLSPVIGLLFISAMLVLLVGLVSFLREVHLATNTMKQEIETLAEEVD